MGRTVTVAKVAQIARNVQSRAAETKSYLAARSQSITSDIVYAHNLLYPIPQNTGSTGIVGKQMHVKNIRFRSTFNTGVITSAPKSFRVLIVKTKQMLATSTSITSFTNVFRSSGGSVSSSLHVDLNKVSVILDKQVTFNTSISGVIQTRHWNFNVPLNKTIKFDADNSGVPKDANYFLIITGTDYSGINVMGQYFYDWAVNFKDE
jgi:hypothetical protein